MSLASVSIVGNLVRDPEQIEFESGRKKTSFHVAVNGFDRVKKEKCAEFYKVELWDRLADLAINYLHKGNQVTVFGRLSMDRWVDRDGKNRCTPLISAGQISLPPKQKSNSSNNCHSAETKEAKSGTGDETTSSSPAKTVNNADSNVISMNTKDISEEFNGKSIDQNSNTIEDYVCGNDNAENGSQTVLIS